MLEFLHSVEEAGITEQQSSQSPSSSDTNTDCFHDPNIYPRYFLNGFLPPRAFDLITASGLRLPNEYMMGTLLASYDSLRTAWSEASQLSGSSGAVQPSNSETTSPPTAQSLETALGGRMQNPTLDSFHTIYNPFEELYDKYTKLIAGFLNFEHKASISTAHPAN